MAIILFGSGRAVHLFSDGHLSMERSVSSKVSPAGTGAQEDY